MVNKKYKLNAAKLMRKKNSNDHNENIKANKSFFCSELVASVYKNMGLLPTEISATQYWPANFA